MASKRFAALAALILVSTPVAAFDLKEHQTSGISFFYSVPLDGLTSKEKAPNLGLTLRGNREHQVINLDTRMFGIDTRGYGNNFLGSGIEAKWVIAGVVGAGALVALAAGNKKSKESTQAQQQQAAAAASPSDGGSTPATGTPSDGGSTTTPEAHPPHPGHYPGDGCPCDIHTGPGPGPSAKLK